MNLHKPWHRLAVQEQDHMTFRVESEDHSGTYMVDALAGVCDCPDFKYRIAPVLSGNKQRPQSPQWIDCCKHLLRVKLWISDALITKIKQQRKEYKGP